MSIKTVQLIGPAGDPGGLATQWWRDGARVYRPGVRPEVRKQAGMNVGAEALACPIGSASASAAASRVAVKVQASPAPSTGGHGCGHGEATQQTVMARAARAGGVMALIGAPDERARVENVGDGLGEWLGAWGPAFETAREQAAGARTQWARALGDIVGRAADVCTLLGWLGLMPGQSVRAWGGGAVARAARAVAAQHGGRVPSDASIEDAAADARLAVLQWWRVVERRAARWLRRGVLEFRPGLLRLAWLHCFRAARRSLRQWGVESAGDDGHGRECLRPVTAETAQAEAEIDARADGDRRAAFASLVRAVRGLGLDLPTAGGQRAKVRSSLRRSFSILRRVIVDEVTLRAACEAEGCTVDAFSKSAARLGLWGALDAWHGSQARAASRPLTWLGVAAGRLRRARAAVPVAVPDADTSAGWRYAADGLRLPGGGVLVRGVDLLPTRARARGEVRAAAARAAAADALARLVDAKGTVRAAAAAARADMGARRELWREVSKGWRDPGKVSGKRRAVSRVVRKSAPKRLVPSPVKFYPKGTVPPMP
ncbi:MAG: hypothetical protein IT579_08115 [Verrucomicrobia subdivision 3 bacterium]|nr:hypothetical protein [Limisphaerales bacterium]